MNLFRVSFKFDCTISIKYLTTDFWHVIPISFSITSNFGIVLEITFLQLHTFTKRIFGSLGFFGNSETTEISRYRIQRFYISYTYLNTYLFQKIELNINNVYQFQILIKSTQWQNGKKLAISNYGLLYNTRSHKLRTENTGADAGIYELYTLTNLKLC